MKTISAVIFISGLLAVAASAQPSPHLAYVYPAGGRSGTTFQIVVGGQSLMTASQAYVAGTGVEATVLDHHRPMNQKEFNDLRDRLKILQDKFQATRKKNPGTNVWTMADAVERKTIQEKILQNPPNRTANPAMIDTVTIQISIATNAAPGEREIRLATPNLLSNPIKFCIGDLPEVAKPAARPANPDLDKFLEKIGGHPAPAGTPKYEARITLPATLNGQIMPGGVDRYRFAARRGQQLVLAVSARSLIPYLADAVPGWFEATLTVLDAKGRELAREERFRFKPDPVIHFEVPRDGEYTVEIHDSIFRGREDFVYRLTVGELPFVTGIFPLGGKLEDQPTVELTGWNLPEKKVRIDRLGDEPGIVSLPVKALNEVPFAVDHLPELFAQNVADSAANAQLVTLPVTINGRLAKPGERAVFQFTGHAGQQIVAEVLARRLDSPLDSFVRLTDAAGNQIASNDDFEDKGTGLNTHHADSYLAATLPADGNYFLHLTDTQGQGGPEFAYRLRLSEPQPDFALRVVPSSLSLRAGMSASVTVFALRRDGFTNAIDLSLKNAPAGFSLSGARINAGQDKAQFTLKAPAMPLGKPAAVVIEGHALIGGARITHAAVPAEDMMQAFIYRHLVASKELAVAVNGVPRLFTRDSFKILSTIPVVIHPGDKTRIRISTPTAAFADRFKLELNNPPEGLSLASISPAGNGIELVLLCDAAKIQPGVSGNLIFDVLQRQENSGPNQKKSAKQTRRVAVATLPAIPFKFVTD